MGAKLSSGESTIISRLGHVGLPLPTASLAVVMVTREHARPQNELVDIVRQYPNLEDRDSAAAALQDLIRRGWLEEFESYGQFIIKQAPDLRETLGGLLADTEVAKQLMDLRSSCERTVRIVGAMSDVYVYSSYLDLLRGAQREICLPMLATSPNLSSIAILKDRAGLGVKVRIMLATPQVVQALRGGTMGKVASDAIAGWSTHACGISNIEIRTVNEARDTFFATSMLIDDTIFRCDVYDPITQRSLEGVMVQFESTPGTPSNVIRVFKRWFDEAWSQASPVSRWGRVWRAVMRSWQFWVFCVFAALTGRFHANAAGGVFGSAAATFMINWLGAAFLWVKRKVSNK